MKARQEEPAPMVRVIDDDPGLRASLARLLGSSGHEVAVFSSPDEFLSGLRPTDRGCLILDVQLPGMSGLDLQAKIRVAELPMPVIIMTGHADVRSILRGIKAGAIDFLLKPFEE